MEVAIVDGVQCALADAHISITDPAVTVGWSVFETLRAVDGQPERLDAHMARLSASARAARIEIADLEALVLEIRQAAQAHGGTCRVRVTLTGGGRRLVVASDLDAARRFQPVRAVRGPHRDDPWLGGRVKHGSRAPWVVAVLRSGVDEVLLVDADGRFTEGTTCAIVAVVDGVLFTAPDDGRILPSTSLQELLGRARTLGVAVQRQGAAAAGPWDALYIASSTRTLAPVVELDGTPLPGWDPIGRRLAGLPEDA